MFLFLFNSQADVSASRTSYSARTNNHSETSTHNCMIGSYGHYTVAIKFLQCETVTPSDEDLLELKVVGCVPTETTHKES